MRCVSSEWITLKGAPYSGACRRPLHRTKSHSTFSSFGNTIRQSHSTFSFDFAPWLRPRVLVWVPKFMLHFLARESTFCWRAREISLQACAWDSFFKQSTSLHAKLLKGHRKVRDIRGKLAYKNCTVPTTPFSQVKPWLIQDGHKYGRGWKPYRHIRFL